MTDRETTQEGTQSRGSLDHAIQDPVCTTTTQDIGIVYAVASGQGGGDKGLRWVSLMLLAEVPWARRMWALPFLTVLAPSRRYHEVRGRRHKTITDWARQMLCRLRRWLPDRELVIVGDRTYATLKLLATCQGLKPITFLTRLRLDAVMRVFPHRFLAGSRPTVYCAILIYPMTSVALGASP